MKTDGAGSLAYEDGATPPVDPSEDDDPVQKWVERDSGVLVQQESSSGQRPIIRHAEMGSHPILDHDGVDDGLIDTGVSGWNNHDRGLWMIAGLATGAGAISVSRTSGNSDYVELRIQGTNCFFRVRGSGSYRTTATFGSFSSGDRVVAYVLSDGSSYKFAVNGVEDSSPTYTHGSNDGDWHNLITSMTDIGIGVIPRMSPFYGGTCKWAGFAYEGSNGDVGNAPTESEADQYMTDTMTFYGVS
jgi:hypothetical protein